MYRGKVPEAKAWPITRVGVALLGLLLALPLMSGCQYLHLGKPAEPAELRVGMAPVYQPLVFKENGELAGVEVDFAHQLADALNVKVILVELTWDELIPALLDQRIDVIMSGMSITEERSKWIRFTQSYLQVGKMALIRRSDYKRLRAPKAMDVSSSTVGFHTDTTSETFVRRTLKHAKLVGFDSPDAGIAALRAKKIDYFIHDAPTIWRVSGGLDYHDPELRGLYRPLTEEYLGWGVRKEDNELRDRLNETLLHWQDTGETEAVLDHWIPVRKITVDIKPSR